MRSCLISLSVSDLIFLIVTGISYSTQLSETYVQFWLTGDLLCALTPFLQTSTVLANSITLTAIALDRYMAVSRFMTGIWEPKSTLCNSIIILTWVFAGAVSSPMIGMYETFSFDVVMVPESGDIDSIDDLDFFGFTICLHEGSENSTVMIVYFCFIFAPLLMTFLFFNSVIAREIWRRRNPINQKYKNDATNNSNGTGNNDSSAQNGSEASNGTSNKTSEETLKTMESKNSQKYRKNTISIQDGRHHENVVLNLRKKRQIQMFKAILAIMLTFFICRLPQWIFTLVKMNVANPSTLSWFIANYTLGILSLTNCALNPLLYTFLNETLKATEQISEFIRDARKCLRNFFGSFCRRSAKATENNDFRDSNGGVYMG